MVLGIIAEYNPFHNGHLYHLLKSKEEAKKAINTDANLKANQSKNTKNSKNKNLDDDAVVAVVGGNFTQRGEPSLVDKWTKAEMAIANGVDLVIELPVLYSISSAENFADGAIKILNSLKIVDSVSFGTETEDLNKLNIIANTLFKEPKEYKDLLSSELKSGKSFPKAREKALVKYLQDLKNNISVMPISRTSTTESLDPQYANFASIMSSPNNILGIEYLKALKKYSSNIKPINIVRKDVGHLSLDYTGQIASATAVRNLVYSNHLKDVKTYTTPASFTILSEELKKGHFVKDLSRFENIIIYNFRNMSLAEIANLPDVSEGLEHLIKKAANSCNTINEFINIVRSKRYTETRIKRILLYCLLGITKKDMAISKKNTPYIRVLGFNEQGKNLISQIKKANPKLSIITSVKKFEDINLNKNLKIMLDKDIFATNVYTLGYSQDSWSNLDYTKKMVN